MVDEPESITLHYQRRIDEKMDRLAGDMFEVKQRFDAPEEGQAFCRVEQPGWTSVSAASSGVSIWWINSLDRFRQRRGCLKPSKFHWCGFRLFSFTQNPLLMLN